MTDYHAALYIRLSKEDDSQGPSESVVNQQSLLEAFARRRQIAIYGVYIDDGWSGTNFERPAFGRMLRDIEQGKVNMVITKDLSRLGRDYIMTGYYMEHYFPQKQVRYISLLDGVDTGVESSANDITPFRAIMNDMYAKDISKKIKSVKHDKQRKGLFIGPKPCYGYRMHPTLKNAIIIDEEAAEIVRRIFAMALSGDTCRAIADRLNLDGIPSPARYAGLAHSENARWSGERIRDILRNQTYLGSMVQGRTARISYKSQKCLRRQKEQWIVVEGTHEPLVSPEVFEKAERLLQSRARTRRRTYDFPFKGLIFCRECGRPLGVVNRPDASGRERLFLICRTASCTSHCIKEETVRQAVLSKVEQVCLPALDRGRLSAVAQGVVQQSRKRTASQTAAERVNARLDRLYADRLNGLITEEDFLRIYQRLVQERTKLDEQPKNPLLKEEGAEALTQRFLSEAFSSREVLACLIERMELTKEKNIILRFRFGLP